MSSVRASHLVIGLLVVLACAARFVHLDADPLFPTWVSYVVDEGRWSESARNLALFGTPDAFAERIHLLLSPAYQAGNFIAFKLFGVSFVSARASAAIAGALVVVVASVALRSHATPFALAFGVIVLGFETNMLAESRLALPEIPSVLLSLIAYFVLVLMRDSRRNAILAGALFAAAVALKGTTVLIAPAFVLIACLSRETESSSRRIGRGAAFIAGLALPLLAGLFLAIALGIVSVGGVTSLGARLLSFVTLADPRSALWTFFESQGHIARNLVLLGLWFCSWLWLHRGTGVSRIVRSVYITSGIWTAWCLVVWCVNAYSPGRYLVHAIVPATIHVMAGLSSPDQGTLARIGTSIQRRGELARAALVAWLVLPTAVVVASALAGLAALAGFDSSRVSARVGLILAAVVLLAPMVWRRRPNDGLIAAFLAAPVAVTLVWLAGFELRVWRHFWEFESVAGILLWNAAVVTALAASFWLAPRAAAAKGLRQTQAFVLVVLAAPLLWQASVPLVASTYSIRDASVDLGRRLSGAKEIRTVSAASLFLENRLRYRELARNDRHFDAAVVFEHNRRSQTFLASPEAMELVRTQTYPLKIDSRYEFDWRKDGIAQVALFEARPSPAGGLNQTSGFGVGWGEPQRIAADTLVTLRPGTPMLTLPSSRNAAESIDSQ